MKKCILKSYPKLQKIINPAVQLELQRSAKTKCSDEDELTLIERDGGHAAGIKQKDV